MIEFLKFALRLSRFRFWFYTAGTYVVGFSLGAVGIESFFRPDYILFLLYFFIPANIFIYGLNDLWDEKTDRENPKKGTREERLEPEKRNDLITAIYISAAISLLLMLFLDNPSRIILGLFLFLSYFYSAKPLRFKSIPFLDFSSNMLYIMPGILGFYLASGAMPGLDILIASYCHIAAMHIFSAIPDIKYDRNAGITTTATLLGKAPSLFLCLVFWSAFSYLVITLSGFNPLSFLAITYIAVPLSLIIFRNMDINRVYWLLPYINTSFGGLVTFLLIFNMLQTAG